MNHQRVIRIGTRDSQLALWQTRKFQQLLDSLQLPSELVMIKSLGDLDQVKPLYALGVQGVFTKNLDAALLSNQIDLAVHSMKDVPTQLAKGISTAAILERGPIDDRLIFRENLDFLADQKQIAHIATGSVRRKAQWLHRFPNHQIHPLRGNVNTRLKKFSEARWDGALFASAGLDRLNLIPEKSISLEWMLPAPAQGAIMVVCRESDDLMLETCQPFHDSPTALCVKLERDFLHFLMGGCSTPIGAHAQIHGDEVHFRGNILSPDGKIKMEINKKLPIEAIQDLGRIAAEQLLKEDTRKQIELIRNALS
ncbi:MAG: hydroxymethylbilane synthase [Chitinophagaceae bacterium]